MRIFVYLLLPFWMLMSWLGGRILSPSSWILPAAALTRVFDPFGFVFFLTCWILFIPVRTYGQARHTRRFWGRVEELANAHRGLASVLPPDYPQLWTRSELPGVLWILPLRAVIWVYWIGPFAIGVVTILAVRRLRGVLNRIRERRNETAINRARERTEKLTNRARELIEDEAYDLVFLQERGFVNARGIGESITKIHASVQNMIDRTVMVEVTLGTYFVARGSHQNMATRTPYRFTLRPLCEATLTLDAVCINAAKPIPGAKNRFNGVRKVSEDLVRFLNASRTADPMTIQAGVWAITDNYSSQDVQARLVETDNHGRIWQAVSVENVAEARRLLDELGIRHRL